MISYKKLNDCFQKVKQNTPSHDENIFNIHGALQRCPVWKCRIPFYVKIRAWGFFPNPTGFPGQTILGALRILLR